MIDIHPQYLPFAKLLNGRLFQIPEYQRAYSWTSRQRDDLFSDILKVQSKGEDAGHFMAAVVCLRRKRMKLGTDEYFVVEVVDGQQRLTTLIILLNCIRMALDEKDSSDNKLARELGELLVKMEGEELLLLQTNHDSSHHFATFLRKGSAPASETAKTIADRELLEAIEECKVFVGQWMSDQPVSALAALLKNRLYFLLHEIEDEKAVYTVFEVLNSRGLDVTWIDRLKSILMGAAFDLKNANQEGLISELHTAWRDIYSVIGLRQGLSTEALRYAATLRTPEAPSRPLGEQDSVKLLQSLGNSAKMIREVAGWMLGVTRACDAVAANRRVGAVSRIAQARLLATSLYLRTDLQPKERNELLAVWERVSFRIYGMLRNDARIRVGEFVRLAWRVVNDKPDAKAIKTAILALGKDFPIDSAVIALRGSNCYEGWESELRYFMFRYEEYLAKEQQLNFSNEQWEKIWMVSPSDSIEHIWARSKAPDKWVHSLGNLVLLPPKLNSKLQDEPPKKKSLAYRQTGLLIAGEVAETIDAAGWNSKSIEAREEALLDWATKEWAD